MIEVKELTVNDITPDMLLGFNHHQTITKKWIYCNSKWELQETYDLREWQKEKRIWITEYLCQQIERGGSVVAAFDSNNLVGFCCVDGCLAGITAMYANLTMLFVDDKWKRRGIGKKLFHNICMCAVKMGADKLFISAIPSFETVEFYFNMGCIDTKEIITEYIDTDQDRYLEYLL